MALSFLSCVALFLLSPPALAYDFSQLKELLSKRACSRVLGVPAQGDSRPPLVVVGLGNTGPEYDLSRHNLGVSQVGALADSLGAVALPFYHESINKSFQTEAEALKYGDFTGASMPKVEGLSVTYQVGGEIRLLPENHEWRQEGEVLFISPRFDINESGHFTAALVAELGIPSSHIVVFYDDIELARRQVVVSRGKPQPLDEVPEFRDRFGDGHNGLRSINELLGRADYWRVKLGISSPRREKIDQTLSHWVLAELSFEDRGFFNGSMADFQQILLLFLRGRGLDELKRQKITAEISRRVKQMQKPDRR